MKPTEFEIIKKKFVDASNELSFTKEASFASQIINASPTLDKCTMESKLMAVLNVAQIGLSLNPALNLCYLVPKYKNGWQCVLFPSYQGLVKLITDTGAVENIYAHTVHKNDIFEYSLGTDVSINHKPAIKDRGEIIASYAVAVLKDGRKQIELIDREELDYIREKSDSYKSYKEGKAKQSPWVDWHGEQCRKTVIKRMFKYLPKTKDYARISQAIEVDNSDYTLDPDSNQATYILSLIDASTLSEEKKRELENQVIDGNIKKHEVNKMIEYLQDSQADKIDAGHNYGQREIHQKLDRMEGKL